MRQSDRPHFDIHQAAHIEMVQNQADALLTQQLSNFLVGLDQDIRPHKRPMQMLQAVAQHAQTLYICEGQQYPQDPRLEVWLKKLVNRIVSRTLKIVFEVEAIGSPLYCSLSYHGVSDTRIRKTARDEVERLIHSRLNPKPAPSPPPPPLEIRRRIDYAASGVDITNASPLMLEAMARVPQQADSTPVSASQLRKALIEPLLAEKGWSILDWANEADVAHATTMDYLLGKTNPYRSTRLKLAKALSIPVSKLPK